MAQPNHLATLLVLGVAGTFALWDAGRLGTMTFSVCAIYLLFGITLTGSRAAWVEMAVLMAWIAWTQRQNGAVRRRVAAPLLGLLYAGFVSSFTLLCQALLLDTGRSAQKLSQLGVREIHWASMTEAILDRPWLGYGWNQVSVAQAQVALEHPATGSTIEHSHNILLDLMVWNGIPLGALLIFAVGWWFCSRARRCTTLPSALLLGGVAVIWIHGMLEYPLEYAYFLLPMGFMMGAVHAVSDGRVVALRRSVSVVVAGVVLVGLTWSAVEYLKLEEAGRRFRMHRAGYGNEVAADYMPKVHLMTQLRAFFAFADLPVKRGLTPVELDHMRRTAFRFTYPPLLMRYALAAGLNSQPEEARKALALLCKTNLPWQCENARQSWTDIASQSYPELNAVRLPEVPVIE